MKTVACIGYIWIRQEEASDIKDEDNCKNIYIYNVDLRTSEWFGETGYKLFSFLIYQWRHEDR